VKPNPLLVGSAVQRADSDEGGADANRGESGAASRKPRTELHCWQASSGTQSSGILGIGAFSLAATLFLTAAMAYSADDDVSLREDQAIKSAVERVAPSVVRIETFGGRERIGDLLVGTGPTTGLAVSADGYVISSAFNFVQKPAQILVHLDNGARLPAKLVATDHSRMIVLLKVNLPSGVELAVPVAAPESEIAVGQWSIAVGRTFDGAESLSENRRGLSPFSESAEKKGTVPLSVGDSRTGSKPSVSIGIISAVNRIWNKAMQTDAKISPNNYGGPLVDIEGRVMGLLVPLSPMASDELAGVEWYDSGIGFAVPLETINRMLPRLEKGEDLYGGLLGISMKGMDIYADEAELAAVQPNSPAYQAGLKPKDKIVEIDGHKIARQAELKHLLGPRYAGDKVTLVLLRGSERLEKTIELVGKLVPYAHPFLGALPMRLFGKDPGVTLRYVYPESPAAKSGLQPGDRITAWEGKPIKSLDELFEQLVSLTPRQKAKFEVHRGDETLKLEAQLAALPETIPGELPPAHDEPPTADGPKAAVGIVKIKIPESQSECIAYVPENYNPRLAYGVVVWLHAPGGFKDEELAARWKEICSRDDLILLAPKSADRAKWQRTELGFVRKTLDDLSGKYHVDRARTIACGQEGGGGMAYLFALANREVVHGVAAIGAGLPAGAQVPANDPVLRMALYIAGPQKDPLKSQIKTTIDHFRSEKYPVTEKDLGPAPRTLSADELSEFARWIDSLDRI
jgi:serine protease Do